MYYVTLDPSLDPYEGKRHFWTKPVFVKELDLAENVAAFAHKGRLYIMNRGAGTDNDLHCSIFNGQEWTSVNKDIYTIQLLETPSIAVRDNKILVHLKMTMGGLLAYSEVKLDKCESWEFGGKQVPNDYPAKGITGSPTTW